MLESIDHLLLRNRSCVAEGDLFSILFRSPYVIRAFEFALADGAVSCKYSHDPHSSFADRLWATEQASRLSETADELLLFDMKASFNFLHHYVSSLFQRRRSAFYICISSADPNFAELIPNYHQTVDFESDPGVMGGDENRKVSVNNGRAPRLPLRTYRLDPTNAPYRMPISLLPQAIERVRLSAQGKGVYINPWTLVEFPDWSPLTTRSTRYIKPAEHTSNFTAYKAAMDIYRMVHHSSALTSMLVDLVGLQPRLADFKLLLPTISGSFPPSPFLAFDQGQDWRQVFVQHKIDSRTRNSDDQLAKVCVTRSDGQRVQYWFSSLNRFDFFFLQFTFSDGRMLRPRVSFLFFPERLIPDSFYRDASQYQCFDRPEFKRYLLAMDEEGIWVSHVQKIVEENPHPQMNGPRPPRTLAPSLEPKPDKTSNLQDEDLTELQDLSQAIVEPRDEEYDERGSAREDLANVMRCSYSRFFAQVMTQCAQRRSGLLVIFSSNHPVCDFGFCRYRWTESESNTFLRIGRPPRVTHELPASTSVVPICYYAQHSETFFEGPSVSSSQFRRLDCCTVPRLILWNLFGPDALYNEELPAVIPSEDISATTSQRRLLNSNLGRSAEEFTSPTPTLSALLHRGRFAAEYRPGTSGPEGYVSPGWDSIWTLLDAFTLFTSFEHPRGFPREPKSYRCSIKDLHQRLAEEFRHQCD